MNIFNIKLKKILIFGFILLFAFLPIFLKNTSASGTTNITIEILALCGNNIKESGEQCDGSDLAGQSCATKGYTGGTLSCNSSCNFDTSSCTFGGGGGGSGRYVAPVTIAIFNGRAYPKSAVTLLKDAQIVATTIADANANFSLNISGLSGGNYIFSVYSEDNKGSRSSLLTFPVGITSGATTQISNIFLAPTIAVDKSEIKRGDNIAIFGQSAPNSEITIAINSNEEFFEKTFADTNGAYLYNFDTAQLETGQHFTKSKAALDGAISSFSKTVSFNIGTKTIFAQPTAKFLKADLNNDGRVNLVDFSIIAYWYKRTISAEFVVKESECLNGDGKVDLVDFSIMAYYWIG